LSLSVNKGRLSYGYWRSLQPSKDNIQHLKTWNFSTFFYFCGPFLPSWIQILIPDSKHWSWPYKIRSSRSCGQVCSLLGCRASFRLTGHVRGLFGESSVTQSKDADLGIFCYYLWLLYFALSKSFSWFLTVVSSLFQINHIILSICGLLFLTRPFLLVILTPKSWVSSC